MRGIILNFLVRDSVGLISGDDGARYDFSSTEWMSDGFPVVGTTVDFINEGNAAKKILTLRANGRDKTLPANGTRGTSPDDGLYKSSDNKMLLGVCAGLAHKYDLNLTGLRIIVFVLCWFWIPIFIYL